MFRTWLKEKIEKKLALKIKKEIDDNLLKLSKEESMNEIEKRKI